jgi:hypothetical protein
VHIRRLHDCSQGGASEDSENYVYVGERYINFLYRSEDLVHMGTSDLVLKKLKIIFLSSKKSENKNLCVANYLFHKRAKYHVHILCILGYKKKM